jgi:hypothetical protein
MMIRFVALFIAVLLGFSSSPARAEWREAVSPHFVVVSGGSERQLVRLSQQLEAVHWMMTLLTGVTPSENVQRVRIYLVDDLADVHRAIGARAGSSVAGFYRPDLTGAIAVVPRSEGAFSTTILFHEYAHHFMLQYLEAAYPGWFVEGFAEFVSTASFEREGSITIGKVANHRQYEIAGLPWVPVPRMFAPRNPQDREAGVASYGQYWVAAHYLLLNADRRTQLNRFMNAVNGGTRIEDAYAVFEGGLDRLDRDMRIYSRRNTFEGRYAALPAGVKAAPVVRILRPAEEAAIPIELQAGRNLDDDEKAELATNVAALVARFPDDPVVALLQTRILFQNEDWAGAEAAAQRTLAIDPANVRAKAWQGWAMLRRMEASGSGMDMRSVSPARSLILQAQRADAADPLPLVAFYESFRIADARPPETALLGIVEAARLVPQEPSIRMLAANAMIASRNLPQARRLLAPLAYAPHRSRAQGQALLILQWVERGAEGMPPEYIEMPDVSIAED